MKARVLVVPLMIALALGPGAGAARRPLITDPRGDHAVSNGDILTADLRTERVGKGVLRIDLELAAAPSISTPYAYAVNFVVGGCRFSAIYYAEPLATSAVGCRDADGSSATLPTGQVRIHGSTITWTVPLGGPLQRGAVARSIEARTAPGGIASGGILDDLGDVGVSHSRYRIGG